MFERISITETEEEYLDRPLDIGLILESMLFYRKTIVICSTKKAFLQILTELGIDNLIKLIESETLELMFNETYSAIETNLDTNNKLIHNVKIQQFNNITKESELEKACILFTNRTGKGKRIAKLLIEQTKSFKHSIPFKEIAKEVFLDKKYIEKAYKGILNRYVPNSEELNLGTFSLEKNEYGFSINSTLDFEKINTIISKIGKEKIILGSGNILADILGIESDIYCSSENLSEIISTNSKNNLLSLRLSYLSEKLLRSNFQKENFLKKINPSLKTIKEEYDSGNIDISKLTNAILHSNKFKKWLNTQENDQDILDSYHSEIIKEDYLSKLPDKVYRWIFFGITGLILEKFLPGKVGMVTGVGLSIADNFFVDKLMSGWRPNQFVKDYLIKSIHD
ncbi:hypothetical protein ND861_18610 [Leptospira sp. 2 VSF19]|uniref:Uncharacterized protein n=1 Tax=Leptospira soteropolitanensis TaxID=2950025 RepID=A0AAW5VHB3_9LEPT|nr:hypothetical protein [Leptospira soteropolitanensis]MCW7494672.1 hypothetical protein [Leptospira soteropolitanensis]MCW7502268.1 hypothetical protein [Leptospira soteropolitanensis]MCW7524496.1 hypothetical protein [Leptospira soteropolitanensis]MCW7528376.1 hypothetical protein [Leptospira soteropolitanensis]MCW7532224.1 hypothetical protein [Leptospira soteropolitanensis]